MVLGGAGGGSDDLLDFAESQAPEPARAQARALLEEAPYPESFPPCESLLVSSDGYLRVGKYRGPRQIVPDTRPPGQSWQIFDPDGAWQGEVETPEGLEMRLVEDSRILEAYRD